MPDARREGLRLEGTPQFKRVVSELPARVERKGLRAAVNAGASPIVKAAKAKAPRKHGFLKKAVGKKVKTYRRGGRVAAIIGAKRDVEGMVGKQRKVPANYYKLVEKGHGGKHPAPPHPSLGPAYESTKQQAERAAAAKLADVVNSEARKLKNA